MSIAVVEAAELLAIRQEEQVFQLQLYGQYVCLKDRGDVKVQRLQYKGQQNQETHLDTRYTLMTPDAKRDLPVVVVIPGLIKNTQSIQYLAYAIALRGCSVIIPPECVLYKELCEPYGVDSIAIGILDFLREVSPSNSYNLVGHSFGALVALRIALIAQRDVKKIAAVSPYLGLDIQPMSAIANSCLCKHKQALLIHNDQDEHSTLDAKDYIKKHFGLIKRAQIDTKHRSRYIYAHTDFIISTHDHLVDNQSAIDLAMNMQHSTIQSIRASHFVAKSSQSIQLICDAVCC